MQRKLFLNQIGAVNGKVSVALTQSAYIDLPDGEAVQTFNTSIPDTEVCYLHNGTTLKAAQCRWTKRYYWNNVAIEMIEENGCGDSNLNGTLGSLEKACGLVLQNKSRTNCSADQGKRVQRTNYSTFAMSREVLFGKEDSPALSVVWLVMEKDQTVVAGVRQDGGREDGKTFF
ncbi:hypothetical protein BgiBS90_026635 [Biomphalaria glabrata]|nr:hypothetical protein BgiBS90_026635 [Biomphalaria glabrata]